VYYDVIRLPQLGAWKNSLRDDAAIAVDSRNAIGLAPYSALFHLPWNNLVGNSVRWARHGGVHLSEHRRFEELIKPHLDAGYNLARWLTRNSADAEDVVQDACVRALTYIDTLHGNSARAWFLTIVRHAFYDWCRRNRPSEIARDDGTAIDTAVDPAAVDPEQAALRSAESCLLADAVAELPLAYREVLILRELEEMSYKEIARIADIPIGTVMSRLARARALLQRSPLLYAIGG
jgi:RNA polymerase sigma-70 factor (ECF subfamily)